ncbi:exo-beta-N-acetylmuramidase NamZ family protein [Melittangium boletus]|uniref:exo-beta-N-acetylmuramidase NamZ family protein n=1 Tax=Melittangium boletus TaxID=83453 RepID=UPI003DA62D90
MTRVKTGLDVWVERGFAPLAGKRVGAIVNPTSVDADFRHLADLLARAPGVTLAALFGPEHGIRGEAQYMVAVDDARDRRTGVPVYSLYGSTFESLSPRPEWLQGLDALVFDIQDVGSRYYTYVYTMALAMKAAAQAKLPFYVLDRPNPLNGVTVEGNLVGERYRSFVGLYPLPNRHGMTAGELARLFNEEQGFGCDLTVVPMEGWRREHFWSDTGLPFLPPSPNMPTADTALVYPGMCQGEGTNVSEGRGTCRPFEQFGAPWVDSDALLARLARERLPGVGFRAVGFTPTFDKYTGRSCSGAFIHVTDRRAFLPLRTGVAIFQALYELGQGRGFSWREDAYEFVDDVPAFDLLCGTDQVRRGIEAGWPLDRLLEGFEDQARDFTRRRERHLLYAHGP